MNRSADALGTDRSFASAGDRVFKGNRADRSEVKLDALLRGPAKSIASVDVLHRIFAAQRQLKDCDRISGTKKAKPMDQRVGTTPEVKKRRRLSKAAA